MAHDGGGGRGGGGGGGGVWGGGVGVILCDHSTFVSQE